jgi:hypothetical protein
MGGRIIEIPARRLSLLWLLAPLAWFGGYFVAAALNHQAFDALVREVAQHNANRTLPFISDSAALVIDSSEYELSAVPRGLLESYALHVVYQTSTSAPAAAHRAFRLGPPEICQRIFKEQSLRSSGIDRILFLPRGVCGYYTPEDPTLDVVKVTATVGEEEGFWLPRVVHKIQIAGSSGPSVDLLAGHAKPLRWFPQPLLGCGPISDGWECAATFMRERAQGLNSEGAYSDAIVSVIAHALGLEPSPAETRIEGIGAGKSPDFYAILAERLKLSLANLDRIIADPREQVAVERNRGRISTSEVPALIDRPDLLAVRADKMVTTLVETLDGSVAARDTSNVLQHLIAALDDHDFKRIGENLLRLINSRPDLGAGAIDEAVSARLGDLGVTALPVLERLLDSAKGHLRTGPILGMCRMGPPAGGLAETIANVLMTTDRRDETHEAAYVTLLRMGRADLADRDPDFQSNYKAKHYAEWRTTVSPSSEATVCTDGRVWPTPLAERKTTRTN